MGSLGGRRSHRLHCGAFAGAAAARLRLAHHLGRNPGKFRTIVYFACLGAGYIMVEVGLISKFIEALSNATVSASVLLSAGSSCLRALLRACAHHHAAHLLAIGALLIATGWRLDSVLDWIGTFPYAMRLLLCFVLVFAGVPDGFPDADRHVVAVAAGQGPHVLWAWGINGCFSVVRRWCR
jgi:hypothetical protein